MADWQSQYRSRSVGSRDDCRHGEHVEGGGRMTARGKRRGDKWPGRPVVARRVVSTQRQRPRSDRSFGEGSLIADAPHSHLSECGAKLRIARAQLAVHRSSRDAERRAEQRSLGSSRPPQRTEGASIGHLVVSGGSHHKRQSAGSERRFGRDTNTKGIW